MKDPRGAASYWPMILTPSQGNESNAIVRGNKAPTMAGRVQSAYLQHLESKNKGANEDGVAAVDPGNSRQTTQHRSSTPLPRPPGTSAVSAARELPPSSSCIPVWKQRRLRSLEQQTPQQQQTRRRQYVKIPQAPPPPPPPPPSSVASPSTISSSRNSRFDRIATGFATPYNSEPQTPETPSTADSTLNSNSSVESSPGISRPRNTTRSQSAPVRRQPHPEKKFGFFKATSPRVEAAHRSLGEKISSDNKKASASQSSKTLPTAAQKQELLSKDTTSNSTQTTYTGSSSDEEDPSKTRNNQTTSVSGPSGGTKSLASVWESHIQKSSQQQRYARLASPKKQQSSPERTQTPVIQSSPSRSSAITSQGTFDEPHHPEAYAIEDETVATSTTPLKVTNQPNLVVAAQWQERIRQKQGKNTTPVAIIPSNLPLTDPSSNSSRIQEPEAMHINQDTAKTTVPQTPADDFGDFVTFSSPLFGRNFADKQQPLTSKEAADAFNVGGTFPSFSSPSRTRALVPFNPIQENAVDDEKKEADAQDQLVLTDNIPLDQHFDDVVQGLTLDLGGEDQAWIDSVLESDVFQNMTNDYLLEIIRDAEMRWKDSSKLSRVIVPSELLCMNVALEHDDSDKAKLIRLQQSKIEELQAKLAEQTANNRPPEPSPMLLEENEVADTFEAIPSTALATTTTTMLMPPSLMPTTTSLPSSSVAAVSTAVPEVSVPGSSVPGSYELQPLELIDSVPIEHIEVAVGADDPDVCSVTSGLTNLQDLVRTMGDGSEALVLAASSSSFADPFIFDNVTSKTPRSPSEKMGSTKIVRRVPLELKAADGSNRKALYTGPVSPNGSYTGFGYFQFEGTGDVYKGEVQNGKMHGQGTYTYARKSRRSKAKQQQHKALRGTFENNVFTGWDPNTHPSN